jgi:hypothetical protein
MNNIDYASMYGVKPGETDFGGAIERSLNEGVKHIGEEFLKMIYDTRRENKKRHWKCPQGINGGIKSSI